MNRRKQARVLLNGSTLSSGNWNLPAAPPVSPSNEPRVRIAIARDEAFSFYYQDALDSLAEAGAELIAFSPLHDAQVPPAGGLLIGGGYPEAYAEALSHNAHMQTSVRNFAASGRPVVAECGGLMYLGDSLEAAERTFPMCGVLPYRTRIASRLTLGYRDAEVLHKSPLAARGE